MFRAVASLVVIVGLVAACGGAPASSLSPRASADGPASGVAVGTTGASPTLDATPSVPAATVQPTPTLVPIRGWPTVSRGDLSLRGSRIGHRFGRLVYEVTVRGVAPGSSVILRARGRYVVQWSCGVEPEPCGDAGCAPLHTQDTRGTVRVTVRATAGTDGVAKVRVRLVAPPPAEACPADRRAPWSVWLGHRWERIRITDAAHGLVLTPVPVIEEDTV